MLALKVNIRNFSRTTSLLLRQVVNKDPEAPIIPESVEKPKDDEPAIAIKKIKKGDKELAQLITLLKTNKKKHDNQIIVEGQQLIKEAVQAHIRLNKLLFSDLDKIKDVVKVLGSSTAGIEFLRVPQPDLNFYSVLQTCPGLIGIFDKPALPRIKSNSYDIDVICDNVREPQNIGALIRVANALPIAKMLLPKGSVDPWDTKSIRGSCGSIFHLPVETHVSWEKLLKEDDKDGLVLIADNNVNYYNPQVIIDYDKLKPELLVNRRITVIIGGETHGISEEAIMYAKRRDYRVINIPIDTTVNSLNVATALGIVLFELRRLMN